MREVIAVASMLFFLAISGSEANDAEAGQTCKANPIIGFFKMC